MICEKCTCKKECSYYETNIKPVLNTEHGLYTEDDYLIALHKVLESYTCEYLKTE